MALYYRIDVLESMREFGIRPIDLRKNKLLAEGAIQYLREGKQLSFSNLSKICTILKCRIEELLIYLPDDVSQPKQMTLFELRSNNNNLTKPVQFIYCFLHETNPFSLNRFEYSDLKDYYDYLTTNKINLDGKDIDFIDNTLKNCIIDEYDNDDKMIEVYGSWTLVLSLEFRCMRQIYGNTISTFLNDFFDSLDNYYRKFD